MASLLDRAVRCAHDDAPAFAVAVYEQLVRSLDYINVIFIRLLVSVSEYVNILVNEYFNNQTKTTKFSQKAS